MGMRVILKNSDIFYQTKSLKGAPVGDIPRLIDELNQNDFFLEKVYFGGKTLISCSLPIESKNGSLLGILQIFDYQSVFDAELRGYQRKVFTSLMFFYAITLTIIFLVIQRNVNRPIATLLREVQNNSSHRNRDSAKKKGHELSLLKQEFDKRESHLQELENFIFQSSREKEALLDQLQQSEKLAALGKFAAGLAHEMGSPISVIEGRALQTLRKLSDPPTVEKNLSLIVDQSRRLSKMIQDVLMFARRRPLNKGPVDLNRIIYQALELFEESLNGIKVEKNLSAHLPRVEGDADQILQVFTNLIRNAIEAMPQSGKLTISTSQVSENREPLPWVRISIRDTGFGMDEDVKSRLFEPFFSRRGDGQGTGLGLSIVYGIIQKHQGRIVVQSQPKEGSQFDIYLPVELVRLEALEAPNPESETKNIVVNS
jgi:signal transduction histidine kinase